MHMPQLVRRETAPDSGRDRGVVQLLAYPRRRARPPTRGSADDAEEPPDRQTGPQLEPWCELRPRPAVHPDFGIKVGFVERERFADSQARTPEDDNHSSPVIGAVGRGGALLVRHGKGDKRHEPATLWIPWRPPVDDG